MTTPSAEITATTAAETTAIPASDPLRVIRLGLLSVYGVIALWYCWVAGVPFDREQIILWTCGALAVASVGRPPRDILVLVRDWIPFTLFLIAYDYTRGLADTLGIPIREREMIVADQILGAGEIPTIRMQEWFYDPARVHWYDIAATLVYNSHFFAVYVIAGVLWARNRRRFGAFVRRYLLLTSAGLATYILFPATPPWLAAKHGEIDEVARISGRGWRALGLHRAESVLAKGQGVVNQVAAMPSLHAAFAALIGAFFWRRASWWMRIVLAGYPISMGIALIYSGEHYLIDVLMGWLYVAGVMVVAAFAERRVRARREARSSAIDDGGAGASA